MAGKICIVGEAWGAIEEEKGAPFQGPSGGLLNAFLASVGIPRHECRLTNVFNFRPNKNPIQGSNVAGPKSEGILGMPSFGKGKYVRAEFKPELDRLYREIRDFNPTIILALGGVACWALLHDPRIKKLRGSPSRGITGHKVFPTYHPAAILREFKLRPVVFADFKKLVREAEYPEIRRPKREFWLYPTLEDLAAFDKFIMNGACRELSVDIETSNRQITCVGFAPRTDLAIVVPFIWRGSPNKNYWPDLTSELAAWAYVKRWIESGIPLVGQNFLYDLNYLWGKYGIRVPRTPIPGANLPPVNDTMLTHHAQQPEMEKSLALLSSLYTDEPQHKFMRARKDTLKQED